MERKYKKPAIMEAVFECRFLPGADWDQTIPGLVYDKLRDKYPKKDTRVLQEFQLSQTSDHVVQNVNAKVLAVFKSDDGKRFIQIGPNMVSVNVLEPYPTWEVFYPMITETLETLSKIVPLQGIERAGLRYINKFTFNDSKITLDDYFTFGLKRSPELPPTMSEFIIGGLFKVDEDQDLCRIQLASEKPEIPNTLSTILDIDYFSKAKNQVPFENLFKWADNAHNHITTFFENCISDNLREMMEVE